MAINQQLEKIYGDVEPRHYAPIIHHRLGGNDPIDGTSVYTATQPQPHLHYVTYGMSKLYYDEKAVGADFSGWGFEFTFRLKQDTTEQDPAWVTNLLNNLARYVFETGNWFEENHFIPANGPICLGQKTDLVALAFTLDPELGEIDTPHGKVAFLQLVGITQKELERLQATNKKQSVAALLDELKYNNPLLITDLARTDS